MNNSPTPSRRLHPAVAGLIVIVLIGLIATAVTAINHRTDNTPSSSLGTTTPTTPPTSSTPTSGNYKDGTYTASVDYFTPDGQEPLTVKLTLANNTITASDVSSSTISGTGQRYFDQFSSFYKDQVVGQKINSLALTRVAGASLTTEGFNQAVQQIMQNAAS